MPTEQDPAPERESGHGGLPLVSVIVANRNAAPYLDDLFASVTRQSVPGIEILFIDDASTDDSLRIAQSWAAADARIRIAATSSPQGPAGARNRALDMARGHWIAIVDSDDIVHPDRLSILLAEARRSNATILADDMLAFDDAGRVAPYRLFGRLLQRGAVEIDARAFIMGNDSRRAALGYLKPLIRLDAIRRHGIRYDETLQVAEDYDLLLRLLLRGERLRVVPELTYFYRRHPRSVSHRITPAALQAMVEADRRLREWAGSSLTAGVTAALDARLKAIDAQRAAACVTTALKAGDIGEAWREAVRKPRGALLLARQVAAGRLGRLRARLAAPAQAPDKPAVCVLSRQRVTLGANGSSTYLIGICRGLKQAGYAVHLVSPSVATLGRMAILDMRRERVVFDRVVIRGCWSFGGIHVARDPRIHLRAMIGIADRLARKAGILVLSRYAKPAPYAVAQPWTTEDQLFVAREARGAADAILADYAFLTPGIPYVLRPRSPSAVVMHDLFSARPGLFAAVGAQDSVASLSATAEGRLLAGADMVIAIQADEAAAARRLVGAARPVLVVPMTMATVAAAQPGSGGSMLFVGSGTAPNVDGLRWFIEEALPRIRAARPDARLRVAGNVCSAIAGLPLPDGVELLGRVDDLAPLYAAAAVVISPLRAGSGLKIKLVEAMANGKAIVATSVTLQGVREAVEAAVDVADDAAAFGDAVLALLDDTSRRTLLGERALGAAVRHFTADGLAAVLQGFKAAGNECRQTARAA